MIYRVSIRRFIDTFLWCLPIHFIWEGCHGNTLNKDCRFDGEFYRIVFPVNNTKIAKKHRILCSMLKYRNKWGFMRRIYKIQNHMRHTQSTTLLPIGGLQVYNRMISFKLIIVLDILMIEKYLITKSKSSCL